MVGTSLVWIELGGSNPSAAKWFRGRRRRKTSGPLRESCHDGGRRGQRSARTALQLPSSRRQLESVDWFKNRRLLGPIGELPATQFDKLHQADNEVPASMAGLT